MLCQTNQLHPRYTCGQDPDGRPKVDNLEAGSVEKLFKPKYEKASEDPNAKYNKNEVENDIPEAEQIQPEQEIETDIKKDYKSNDETEELITKNDINEEELMKKHEEFNKQDSDNKPEIKEKDDKESIEEAIKSVKLDD